MDVEGHEYEALLGMERLLKTEKPILAIEIHETSLTKASVFDFLEKVGYTSYMRLSHCDYVISKSK